MDSKILQLFPLEELLERLSMKRQTGALHVFVVRDAADLFFKEGILVSAYRGAMEGEDVLKSILEWKEAHCVWQAGMTERVKPNKPLQINMRDYLVKSKSGAPVDKVSPFVANPIKAVTPKVVSTPVGGAIPVIAIPHAGAATTMPVGIEDQARPVTTGNGQGQLTATKAVSPNAKVRSAQEEALLNKHRFVLVSLADPSQKVPIARVSSLIGRNPACDITIDHGSISRQHCLLQITERGLHVKDLDTTNGTKVNGIPLTEGYISLGDKLTMGHLVYELVKG